MVRARHPCSMTNECAWRCSHLCTTAERGADGVRQILRHDRCIPSGLSRSTVRRGRFAKASRKPSGSRNEIVGTTKRSIAILPSAWFRRNVFHPCEGGPLLRTMHLATLIRPMSSLRSSPSILALPTTVGDLHLADQHFQRHSRSAAAVRQFAAPTQSETGAVPTDRCIRLHNRQRLDGILHQRYRPTKIRQSVPD